MNLSILIPTLPQRKDFLKILIAELNRQLINDVGDKYQVEILTDQREEITTGQKRNDLLKKSIGEYTWFIDDDDMISPDAIEEILIATASMPDVIGINGVMTTDGKDAVDFEIRLGHPYIEDFRDGKRIYLRWPNHITPMKREHAMKVRFPNKTIGEDYQWSEALMKLGALQTQAIIDKPIYFYKFRSKK